MPQETPFETVGRQVSWRLMLIKTIQRLNLTVGGLSLGLLLGFAGLRLLGQVGPEWIFFGIIFLGWIVAVLVIGILKRPSPFQALAHWDEAAGGKSEFASAEFFETLPVRTVGETLHLERARTALQRRQENLNVDLPLPRWHWGWCSLPLLVLFLATPWFHRTVSGEDQTISVEMAERVSEEAASLVAEKADLERIKDLVGTEDQRQQLEELGLSLDETVEMLGDAGQKSAREILEELESRARAAEKLANQLGGESGAWASDAMLGEMAAHADTADLAAAIQEKNARQSADEAERIAEKLADAKLTIEARERIDTALGRTMEKAEEEDRQKPVGEHVGNASTKLALNLAKPAAQDFENLAGHFQDVEQRQRAQSELKELADRLRQSGNEIAQSQLEPMKQLGNQDGPKPPDGATDLAQQLPPQVPPNGPQGTPQTLQAPGPQNQQAPPGQAPPSAPVPGMQLDQEQQPQGQQMAMAPVPGQTAKPGQGQPGLMAPVPGQAPGSSSPSNLLGGKGSAIGAPGLEAGFGTADLAPNPTEAMVANKDAMVDATINEDGESTIKTVQGGVRREAAQREKQARAAEFVAVEEEALDAKALPAARRDQVLRYFTALRERFETDED